MLSPEFHAERRRGLVEAVGGPVLLVGNGRRTRNLPLSELPFRQDSSFLYFTGCHTPGAACLLDAAGSTLFLPEPADDDPLWHGQVPSLEEQAERLGFDRVNPVSRLEEFCERQSALVALASSDPAATERASRITGEPLSFGDRNGHPDLVSAVVQMRLLRSLEELDQMRAAAVVTERAHRTAMSVTRPGHHERQVAAAFHAVIEAAGLCTAYPSIVTVRGEVLHNFHHVNTLVEGDLLLLDGGAEAASGFATDVTRTWPVSGRFDGRQRAVYEAVLASQQAGIDRCRAGVRYREVHDVSSRVLADFLRSEGLLRCDADTSIETGAHAVFFPHGVGHLIGLDVHDLEAFGDQATYAPGRTRSPLFGTAYLRLDLDLEPGMVVTVEPGFYVVPAILEDRELQSRLGDLVDFERARTWLGFGGIRIEDDVAITQGAPEVLTGAIPRTIDAVEAAVGTSEGLTLDLG